LKKFKKPKKLYSTTGIKKKTFQLEHGLSFDHLQYCNAELIFLETWKFPVLAKPGKRVILNAFKT
jgi:hypothetical protein